MALFGAQPITSSGEPFTAKHYLKLFIVCLSYANLCFLNVWAEIYDRGSDFLRKYTVTWQAIAALTLDILIVAGILFGVVYLALSTGRSVWVRLLKWCMILALLIPVNVLRTDQAFASMQKVYIPHALPLRLGMVAAGAALGIFLLLRWERLSTRVTTLVLVLIAPSMPLALGNAVLHLARGPEGSLYNNKPLQPALPQPGDAPRVMWVLFDEWDRNLTFDERPAGLALPEVDQFRQQAIEANRVIPPSLLTIVSVPSLLTGKTWVDTKPQIPSEILLIAEHGKPGVPFTGQGTIFTEARRLGFNVGIAGWYMPYCRLIAECTECSWHAAIGLSGRQQFEMPVPVTDLMQQAFLGQVKKIPLLYRLGIDLDTPARKRLHALSYQEIHDDMLRIITDPRLNLVYVHMSVPHPPAIFDAGSDKFSSERHNSYLDNLRLVDRAIGEIRQTLEKAGLWDTTNILLTADHPLRLNISHEPLGLAREPLQHEEVPYLLKLAGRAPGISYNKAMQEIVTKELLLAILSRRVTTPAQVAAWLDSQPQNGPRP